MYEPSHGVGGPSRPGDSIAAFAHVTHRSTERTGPRTRRPGGFGSVSVCECMARVRPRAPRADSSEPVPGLHVTMPNLRVSGP